jgi:biopolymer transport protein ExbD/biopolymer transport protein TolR
MAIVKRDEGKKVNSNINVTPMVDVMLVLLIIFMVITPMLENKVNVTLAQTENAVAMEDASKEDAITIAITRDSKVFLGQDQTSIADLGPKVLDLLKDKTNKMVFFRSDARAHYGTVMDAIDAVRTTGVDEIGLLTDNRQPNQPPPPANGGE